MQKVSDYWYRLINYSYGAVSSLVLISFGFGLFGVETELINSLGINVTVAVFALIHFVLSLVLFPLLSKNERSYNFGLTSACVFFMTIVFMVSSGGELQSVTVALLFLMVITIGAFGYAAIGFSGIALFSYFIASRAVAITNFTQLNIYDISFLFLSIASISLSFLIWRKHYIHYGNQTENEITPVKKISSSRLVELIRDGVVVVDSNGNILEFNPAGSDMLGWSIDDAKGLDFRSIFKFVDETGRDTKDIDPITQALRENKPISNQQMIIKNRLGKLLELSVSVAPFQSEDGQKAVIAVMRDVSEQNQQQRQKAEFISTASHEMRTPVAAIEGYLSLALNQKVSVIDEKARNYLERAHETTIHLGELFRDLLTASKSEDGRLESHPEPIELGSFLEKLTSDIRFSAEKKGLELKYVSTSKPNETITPLYYAMVDRERLREVITNLIDNAVKFTKQGGISISLSGDTDRVKITITDTGIGMPAEDIKHLFQKFYRIDNSDTRRIGGTGLGLFICKQIVELYNGRIWAESELGKGSSFFIELPRLDQAKVSQTNDTSPEQ